MEIRELLTAIQRHVSEIQKQTGKAPSLDDLAKRIGVTPNKVRRALRAMKGLSGGPPLDPVVIEGAKSKQVLLFDETGEHLGVVSLDEAQRCADGKNLVLQSVAQEHDPPIFMLADYGKVRYEADMVRKETKRKQNHRHAKKITIRATIQNADLAVKTSSVRKFISNGDMVDVTIEFGTGESERAREIFDKLAHAIEDIGSVDSEPEVHGSSLSGCLRSKPRMHRDRNEPSL